MLNKRSLLSQFLHFSAATVASLMVFSLVLHRGRPVRGEGAWVNTP